MAGRHARCGRRSRQRDGKRIAAQHHQPDQPADCPLAVGVGPDEFGDVADLRRLGFGLPSFSGHTGAFCLEGCVSVAAMIKRCEVLGIVGDDGACRLCINYNRRGWRILEPFDCKIEKERPRLLRRSMTMLLSEQEQSVAQVLAAVPLTPKDIDELCDLDAGTLTGDRADARAMPVLKRKPQSEPQRSNVVQMFRRRE